MIGIYKITNPKGQAYIGLSKNIEVRFNQHKNLQFQGNNKLRESLTQYGGDSHLFEVLEEVDISSCNRNEGNALLRRRERYWINKLQTYNNGLNENKGGSGCSSHTDESKRKIGEANSKPKPADFGAKRSKAFYTDEWRKKISEATKGRTSPNKGKVGANKGKVMSEEQKRKISEANKGRKKPAGFKPPGRPKRK